jgi:hypothetical protein
MGSVRECKGGGGGVSDDLIRVLAEAMTTSLGDGFIAGFWFSSISCVWMSITGMSADWSLLARERSWLCSPRPVMRVCFVKRKTPQE